MTMFLYMTGKMGNTPEDMALFMMECIGEFANSNKYKTLNLVKIRIFQADMVAIYLQKMEEATHKKSGFGAMISSGLKRFGSAIKGLYFFTPCKYILYHTCVEAHPILANFLFFCCILISGLKPFTHF